MKMELRPRDRRALVFLGIAVAGYMLLTAAIFPAYDRLAAAREAALEKEGQLRRYRRAVVRKTDYGQLLEEVRRRIDEGEARLIRGDNPSLASSELQTVVEQVAEATGIELGQRNMSPARQKDDFFDEVTMTFGFECTPGQFVRFLSELRAAGKLITVRSVQVAPVEVVNEVAEGEELKKDIRVNLTVGAVLASAPVAEPDEG